MKKTASNLLTDRKVYNRYYDDFRGVDFTNDHTQVNEKRFAYLHNMFKNYQSANGQAIETMVGYRKRVQLQEDAIYGIHTYEYRENGIQKKKILIHSGTRFYLWMNYPKSIGVKEETKYTLKAEDENVLSDSQKEEMGYPPNYREWAVNLSHIGHILQVEDDYGRVYIQDFYNGFFHMQTFNDEIDVGSTITITYINDVEDNTVMLYEYANEHDSQSFCINNKLYIIDGMNYLVFDGSTIKDVSEDAYIPITNRNAYEDDMSASGGNEYQQKNMLTDKYIERFIADGVSSTYTLSSLPDEIVEVRVYGTPTYDYEFINGQVSLYNVPSKPTDVGYDEKYDGIEIEMRKTSYFQSANERQDSVNVIKNCTIGIVYDDRLFLSGNPQFPNEIFYTERDLTGYSNPSYFGILNHQSVGITASGVVGMTSIADTLLAVKQEGTEATLWYLTPSETEKNIQPKIYPSVQGKSGIGGVGACTNFLDDAVFVSKFGLEGIGSLSVRLERAVEHRSRLVDGKLVNMDLSKAKLTEWNGYLLLYLDGMVFMADSRQKYADNQGITEYEWYYLEDIGVYKNQYTEYKYDTFDESYDIIVHYRPSVDRLCTIVADDAFQEEWIPLKVKNASEKYNSDTNSTENLIGSVANPPSENGTSSKKIHKVSNQLAYLEDTDYNFYVTVEAIHNLKGEVDHYEAYYVRSEGAHTGGIFHPAILMTSIDNNIFFGTDNGTICSFNFDLMEDGELPSKYYNYDGRTINCGIATKMDNCGVPHLNKSTEKKSLVIKLKTLSQSALKLSVRTNKKSYEQVSRLSGGRFSFTDMDFADFTFNTEDSGIHMVREKEKRWVEKQYYIHSDEYEKTFALFYISYRYIISGRYKE